MYFGKDYCIKCYDSLEPIISDDIDIYKINKHCYQCKDKQIKCNLCIKDEKVRYRRLSCSLPINYNTNIRRLCDTCYKTSFR